MNENLKNNIVRATIGLAMVGTMWLGISACDTGSGDSSDCKDQVYYSQHVADCNDDGVISPYGYGMNY